MKEFTTMNLTPDIHVDIDRLGDDYPVLLSHIQMSFHNFADYAAPLFTTDATDLFDIFLNGLPEEARQHYNCRACRNFVNRYGGLVTIASNGVVIPVMWTISHPFFDRAMDNVNIAVIKSKVTGVFLTSEKRLGTPKTGVWTHMSVDIPKGMIYKDPYRLKNAEQAMAEKAEDFKMLVNAVAKYKQGTVETAVNLLKTNSLYRGEKVLGMAEWFLTVTKALNFTRREADICKNERARNLLWRFVAIAPAGFCHVSSSMIGTLLDDIENGLDYELVERRFNEKMNPTKYQRPQALPSAGNVKRAEEIVAKMGIENSLKRRFAKIEEIPTIWKPVDEKPVVESTSIFADLSTKQSVVDKKPKIMGRTQTMTWEKFQRTVLPDAIKIELHTTEVHRRGNYGGIVTAEDMDAPPIIAWDTEENRNPFSWYMYSTGSYSSSWNLPYSTYVEVTGITYQPSMWQEGYERMGNGVFFILKGCKDTRKPAACLFPEILRGELREVRSTIEEYSRKNTISGRDEATACGMLFQQGRATWDCTLRVTTDIGVTVYHLDRWD